MDTMDFQEIEKKNTKKKKPIGSKHRSLNIFRPISSLHFNPSNLKDADVNLFSVWCSFY